MLSRLAPSILTLTLACTNEPGSTDDEGGEGSAPPPGPSAEGWQSAYVDGGVNIACDQSEAEMAAAGAPSLAFEDVAIYVGFEQQVQNQNPVFARFDAGVPIYCQVHETETPDGRIAGITWDGGEHAYVVYTTDGGGSALDGKGGWLSAYAPGSIHGGGPRVSVVGRVATADGTLEIATFVIAAKEDSTINTHGPRGPVTRLPDGNVEFLGSSAHKPIDADGATSMDCSDYPFDSKYVFSSDLSTLICAECSNCTSQRPCD